MSEKNSSGLLTGILLIIITLIFTLKFFGILEFSVLGSLKIMLPLSLLLIGLAIIFRNRWLAASIFILMIALGIFYLTGSSQLEQREVLNEIPFEEGIDAISIGIDYGAGKIKIGAASPGYLIRHIAKTTDANDPSMEFEKNNSKAKIKIERQAGFSFLKKHKDSWNIALSQNVEIDMKLNYGAANMEIDLKKLKVKELDIDSGATSTQIAFGIYPTKANIDTGVSSLDLKFPGDIGVMIDMDTGAISIELEGFRELEKNKFYSLNYDENKENIEVKINAGASSIKGKIY